MLAAQTATGRGGRSNPLRLRQDALQAHLLAVPAANCREAAAKARYLLNLFSATLRSEVPRRQKLIAAVLADFDRQSSEP
jgi:hypothetical protein